ncbi:MAG TPA: response regulator transcription factor [Anaerolineales bacterium]|nr:response regulator transcription factor [Anaerolineales bacterium]
MQHRKKNQNRPTGTILWIKGAPSGNGALVDELRGKGLTIESVPTGKAALRRLDQSNPQIVVVDAESLRTSGLRICQSLHEARNGDLPVILIANPGRPIGKTPCVRFTLKQPFTVRKIYNRIAALLPSDGNQVEEVGAIALDLDRSVVSTHNGEHRLTPRLAKLLKMLMDKPGEVIERETLFKAVWNTEYMGDTRTLDVHISWLRGAIEKNPRRPRHLITIRGVGYRLDP